MNLLKHFRSGNLKRETEVTSILKKDSNSISKSFSKILDITIKNGLKQRQLLSPSFKKLHHLPLITEGHIPMYAIALGSPTKEYSFQLQPGREQQDFPYQEIWELKHLFYMLWHDSQFNIIVDLAYSEITNKVESRQCNIKSSIQKANT